MIPLSDACETFFIAAAARSRIASIPTPHSSNSLIGDTQDALTYAFNRATLIRPRCLRNIVVDAIVDEKMSLIISTWFISQAARVPDLTACSHTTPIIGARPLQVS